MFDLNGFYDDDSTGVCVTETPEWKAKVAASRAAAEAEEARFQALSISEQEAEELERANMVWLKDHISSFSPCTVVEYVYEIIHDSEGYFVEENWIEQDPISLVDFLRKYPTACVAKRYVGKDYPARVSSHPLADGCDCNKL